MNINQHQLGLYDKFTVTRTDGSDAPGGKHENADYFVLDLTDDPYARPAMLAYADACQAEYPNLANDIRSQYQTYAIINNNPASVWYDQYDRFVNQNGTTKFTYFLFDLDTKEMIEKTSDLKYNNEMYLWLDGRNLQVLGHIRVNGMVVPIYSQVHLVEHDQPTL